MAALVVCLHGQHAPACTGESRSLDFLVLESALIVDGEITAVTPADAPREGRNLEKGQPCIADVRVIEILKGATTEAVLKVRNGPVHS